jgi:hypothetical protein
MRALTATDLQLVMPAKAGIHFNLIFNGDSLFQGNDRHIGFVILREVAESRLF